MKTRDDCGNFQSTSANCIVCTKPEGLHCFYDKHANDSGIASAKTSSTVPGYSSLAAEVAKLEKIVSEQSGCLCGQIRATMLVNYGDEGRAIAGLVRPNMSTIEMVVTVLRHLHGA